MNNISLVGMPGAGKSTVGRVLAKRLSLQFIDLDQLFEQRFELSISSYFKNFGEELFRVEEAKLLLEVLSGTNQVISTGGGCILSEANRCALREKSMVIYLKASADMLVSRIQRGTHRPHFQGQDVSLKVSSLLDVRSPLYESVAHLSLDIGAMHVKSIVSMVARHLKAC